MWFAMPKGTSGIAVELQEFKVEVVDAEGIGYFRAPDYLAPKIIDLPGFRVSIPPTNTDLEDFPPGKGASPNDSAIADLAAQLQATTMSRDDAHQRLQAALSQIDLLGVEINRLRNVNSELQTKLDEGAKKK
jgi:hypothetical protein